MGEPGSLKPTVLRWLMHTCIIFRRAFISPLMITPAVLFIWLKAQMICIDSLFIHCWTRHCIYECRQNGPNYSERRLPVTPQQRKMMKVSNWEEKSNQRPLVVFCKFKNQNGKHFLLWLTMVHLGLQIRLATHTHVSGLPHFLITWTLPVSFTKPSTLFPEIICQWIHFVFKSLKMFKYLFDQQIKQYLKPNFHKYNKFIILTVRFSDFLFFKRRNMVFIHLPFLRIEFYWRYLNTDSKQ